MTDQDNTFSPPDMQELQPKPQQDVLRPDVAIAHYHRMGPTHELVMQDSGRLIELAAQTLLEPAPNEKVTELTERLVSNLRTPSFLTGMTPRSKSEAASMLADSVDALGMRAEHSSEYKLGKEILIFVERSYQSIIEDRKSTPSERAAAYMGVSSIRDELTRRGVRLERDDMDANGVRRVRDSEESWRVRAMQGVLRQREHHSENGVVNGIMFEYVVTGLLQFKQWESESEDATTYARLARGREDQPAGPRTLNPRVGIRVAHDVVLMQDGSRTRIQAKWGDLAEEFGADRYDHSVITDVTDMSITGQGLNALMQDTIDAYKGSEAAIARVNAYIAGNRGLRNILTVN